MVRIALRLRREKTMMLGWVAPAPGVGAKTYLSHLLHWLGREKRTNR